LAAGAQFDREDASFTPDPFQAAGDNLDASIAPTGGGYNVFAGFLEVDATLLQHVTGIDKLELTGAIRAGTYNTFGGFVTGKGGVRWQVTPDVAVRGTLSNAFRAPNVSDLYAGATTSFPGVSDPCGDPMHRVAQCDVQGIPADFSDDRGQLPEIVGGNAALQPEKATTFTAGLVFTPTFFKGFSVTLDYFNINIDDVIGPEGAQVILNNCYNNGNAEDCAKVHRDPATHVITSISDPNINAGGFKTSGLDFDIAYRFLVPRLGNIRVNLEGTWLHKFEESFAGGFTVDGLDNYDLSGVNASLKFNGNIQWAKAGWSAGAGARFVGPWHECQNNDCNPDSMNPRRDIPAYVVFNAFVSRDFKSP